MGYLQIRFEFYKKSDDLEINTILGKRGSMLKKEHDDFSIPTVETQ